MIKNEFVHRRYGNVINYEQQELEKEMIELIFVLIIFTFLILIGLIVYLIYLENPELCFIIVISILASVFAYFSRDVVL